MYVRMVSPSSAVTVTDMIVTPSFASITWWPLAESVSASGGTCTTVALGSLARAFSVTLSTNEGTQALLAVLVGVKGSINGIGVPW